MTFVIGSNKLFIKIMDVQISLQSLLLSNRSCNIDVPWDLESTLNYYYNILKIIDKKNSNRLGVIGNSVRWGQKNKRTSQLLDWIGLGADSVKKAHILFPQWDDILKKIKIRYFLNQPYRRWKANTLNMYEKGRFWQFLYKVFIDLLYLS